MYHIWEDEKCIQHFTQDNPKEINYFEDLGIDGRLILKWILKKQGVMI
jgi:hypothetical protein